MTFNYVTNAMDVFWKRDGALNGIPYCWQPILAPVRILQGTNPSPAHSALDKVLVAEVHGFVTIPYFKSEFENDSFVDDEGHSQVEMKVLGDLSQYFSETYLLPSANLLSDYTNEDGKLPENWGTILQSQQVFSSLVVQELASLQGDINQNDSIYVGIADMQQGSMLGSVLTLPSEFYDSLSELLDNLRSNNQ